MSRREAIGKSAAEAAFDAVVGLGRSVRYEIKNPHLLEDARNHLNSSNLDTTSSLVILANVTNRTETIVLADVIANNLAALDHVSAITSVEFLDSKKSRLTSAIIRRASEAKGFRIFPVVPPEKTKKYIEDPEIVGAKNPNRFTGESLIRAVELLKKPGQILVISPEQTTENNNVDDNSHELSRAYEGLDLILRHSRTTSLILPITLRKQPKRREGFIPKPPYSKIVVTPGPMFSHEDVQDEYQRIYERSNGNPMLTMNDLVMMRLAELLPPLNQGYYRGLLGRD